MSAQSDALYAHLATGCTTVCHRWLVERADGQRFGFTDHDRDIVIDGVSYRADASLTAQALQQTTGMAVDNTEAIGALSSLSITTIDISAGRFDRAVVTAWVVNWQDLTARTCLFRGTIGEITQVDGIFRAELRGLTDALNQPQGRTYQRSCGAILGDARCGVDLMTPEYAFEFEADAVANTTFMLQGAGAFADRWFERGTLVVLSGDAAGLTALIKVDELGAGGRRVVLWEGLAIALRPGDRVRITAGCDRLIDTCRVKFSNISSFRGFPHIPGEDWLASYPVSSMSNTGGSRNPGAA